MTNGICMSTLHHAAFDRYLIGVDPDLRIHVAESVIRAPVQSDARPHADFLEWRFSKFRDAHGRVG